MNKNLSIIIPAYKSEFLRQSLESIANQTCKDFVLYIGDDASPYNIFDIVKEYETRIEIRYTRFDKNVGGKDLVSQWERCIGLSKDEKWIWLFSDDDVMDCNCVANFYHTIQETEEYYDIYRFNTARINGLNQIIIPKVDHPLVEKGNEFLIRKLKAETESYAVEYIFCRSIYDKLGFVNFAAAWASDDASWALWGKEKGIRLIQDSIVYWRYSEFNISGAPDLKIARQKLLAVVQFINWVTKEFNSMIDDEIIAKWAFFQYKISGKSLSISDKLIFCTELWQKTNLKKLVFLKTCSFFLFSKNKY